ncbi:HAMP domain-containing sensor histidine kinase [Planococcus shenhongbingii]|uniref:histidine kinase n=1 Tax=Planococcus shenhongbingii TaxID=3058398 RepID=A0ABT8NAV3_9BACL|nr:MULTISPECIES: HAMP domain-containing sensor histidine kinase [unclassified Planococcus (in: firmicutes)]MDN7244883.1 HAMP domain-containing sensor histidine kinase [Planococcus sp. N017]WKA57999.1 HAMP domain-containing sensor histidine kinase [Planococcus sp. N016]
MKKWLWLFIASFIIIGCFSILELGSKYFGKSYLDTADFETDFVYFTDRLIALELDPLTDETAVPVTSSEIEEYRNRNGTLADQLFSIRNQYESDIQEAISAGNKDLEEALTQEREKKVEEIRNNFSDDEAVVRKILMERKESIEQISRDSGNEKTDFLKDTAYYVYELTDLETKETFTKGQLKEQPYFEKTYSKDNPLSSTGEYSVNMNSAFFNTESSAVPNSSADFVGTIQIDRSLLASSEQGVNFMQFTVVKSILYAFGALVIAGIVVLWTHLRFELEWFIKTPFYVKWSRLTMDSRFLLAAISIVFALFASSELFWTMANTWTDNYIGYGFDLAWKLIAALGLTALSLLQIIWLFAYYRKGQVFKYEFQQSFMLRSIQNARQAFLNKSIGIQTLMLLIIVFFWGAGTLLLFIYPQMIILWLPASALLGLPAVLVMLNRFGYLNVLMLETEAMASGRLNQELPIRGKSPLAQHARQLNRLKEGVKMSMSEQAKSERLKTELITNVSHDLRTPLTSIITYTDLMKTPDLSNEERLAYAEILDRKSQRLKTLIEDLFEVSKMASGNIELQRTRIDLNQLLQQALAEHAEDIGLSGLDFRVTNPNKPVPVHVDGQKWWRVFDNLILNAIKYALPGTRVYLSLSESDGQAEFVIKNITRYELGENTDELFERFKRGDASRQTEGSGLGLAISQSIVDLHGGVMKIEVDGDLFKVMVSIHTI